MINVSNNRETTPISNNLGGKELLQNLDEETKIHSRDLAFSGLDYTTKREKVTNITNQITDILYAKRFHRFRVLIHLLKEIIKNAADHTETDTHIVVETAIDNQLKKIYVKFLITDN